MTVEYRVVPSGGAWLIALAGEVMGPYPTRAAACMAAIGPVSAAIARGHDVRLTVTPTAKASWIEAPAHAPARRIH